MKKRIKYLITLGILSISLISNNIIIQAIDKPIPPPDIEGEITNEKIKEYNQKAEIYNSQVDEYNQQIDRNYEAAMASVQQQNAEIDAHNAAEDEKVRAVEATNAQLQAEYDTLYAQYEKDLEYEALIKSKGYESVEAYNAVAEANNAKVAAAESINSDSSTIFDITKSYTITSASEDEPSNNSDYVDTSQPEDPTEPEKVKVNITHNFMGFQEFTTSIEILETDTITFYAAGAQCSPTEPDLCQFYMYSDGNLVKGYWSQSFSQLMCTANINTGGWQNGDIHTVSYKEGKKHPSDSTDIDIEYYYYWTDLKLAKIFNVPVKPELNLESYTPDKKEHVPDPVKEEYLQHINLKDLLPEPDPEPTPVVEPEPTPKKPKKKKKHTKEENKKEEEQKQEEENNDTGTQPSDPTPAPAQTSTITTPSNSSIVTPSYQPRRRETGDYTIINFRIAIVLISILVLLIVFFFHGINLKNNFDLP